MCGSNVKNVICIQKRNLGKLVRRPNLGDLSVDGRIRLKIMLKELVARMLTGSLRSGCCLLAGYVIE